MRLSFFVPWLVLIPLGAGCGSSDAEFVASTGGSGGGGSGGVAGASSGGAAGTASGGGGTGGTSSTTGGSGGTGQAGAGGSGGGTGGTGAGGNTGGTSAAGGSGGCPPATGGTGGCGNDGTSWNTAAQAFECQVIAELNTIRAAGTTCGTKTAPPVGALTRNQVLTDNARAHSEDMATNSYFNLVKQDGTGPIDWSMKNYCGGYVTAQIGGGQASPHTFLMTIMNVETECMKLMIGGAKGIGVGYYTDSTGATVHMWTLVIGSAP